MIMEIPKGTLLADGMELAFVGIGRRCGEPDIAVYDYDKMVENVMMRDGMSYDEAVEYIEFNVVDGYNGPKTPLWLDRMAHG
tara:strand:- start:689 stop:934 length:246 start_codon:yes stop_codon:yes gene_type:complete